MDIASKTVSAFLTFNESMQCFINANSNSLSFNTGDKLIMLTSLKKIGRSCLLLICVYGLNACNKPTEQVSTYPPAQNSTEILNSTKETVKLQDSSFETMANRKNQIAGSKASGKWIYSSDGLIACRIKEWYVLGTKELPESYINVEVNNVKSKKPVNAVYELLAIDNKGQALRTISNAYKDNQPNLTDFKPPLKKGQTKVSHIHSKLLFVMSKLDLKKCRVLGDNENHSTINPEMKDYVGP
jgi:hypothetical protein